MPEQDDWKEEFDEKFAKQANIKAMLRNSSVPIVELLEIKDFISSLLSSQAHTLKEQMKACVPEEIDSGDPDNYDWEMGHEKCREQTLSALNKL